MKGDREIRIVSLKSRKQQKNKNTTFNTRIFLKISILKETTKEIDKKKIWNNEI